MDGSIPVELIGNSGEFYPGYITGYCAPDQFVFRFVGEDSLGFPENVIVSPTQLRKPPNENYHEVPHADVSAGDAVEALLPKPVIENSLNNVCYKTGDLPPSWWPARVTNQRGDFVVVEFEATEPSIKSPLTLPSPSCDKVLEKNQIRQRNTNPLLSLEDFSSHVQEIPLDLAELFKEPNNIEHLSKACKKPILICDVTDGMKLPENCTNKDRVNEKSARFLILCTSKKALLTLEILEEEIVKLLKQKNALMHKISDISKRVKEKQTTELDSLFLEEFSVPPKLVGHSIGHGGCNIRESRKVEGVVSVILDPETSTYKVFGKSKEAVENARRMLEYTTDVMQVPQEYVGRILGQKNRNLQTLVDNLGLAMIRLSEVGEATVPHCVPFTFTGTKSAIQFAMMFISFNIENFREIDELLSISKSRRPRPTGARQNGRGRPKKEGGSRSQHDGKQDSENGVDTDGATLNGNTGSHHDVEYSSTDQSTRYPPRTNKNHPPHRRNNNGPALAAKRGGIGGPRQNSLPPNTTSAASRKQFEQPTSDSNSAPRNRGGSKSSGGGGGGGSRGQTRRARENSQTTAAEDHQPHFSAAPLEGAAVSAAS